MKLEETDAAVTVQPAAPARAAVIWMHGLGADGYDFVPIIEELNLAPASVRFIFPHAPVRPVTLNGGMPMRAWYDIKSLDRAGIQDEAGIRRSETRIRELIAAQAKNGIVASKVVLAGFSQGGAIALHTALRFEQKLAGLMVLSSYLPLGQLVEKEASEANRDIPILMCHGQSDSVLPIDFGEHSRDHLRKLGYTVDWHAYPMAHQVCAAEIAVIGRWLRQRFAE